MSAAFYWYPDAGATLDRLVLNSRISRAEPFTLAQASDEYSGAQGFVRSFNGVRRRVRIAIDRKSLLSSAGATDYRRLQTLISHLKRGGAVGFTTDTTQAVAAYPSGGWEASYSYVASAGNAFASWESSAALAAGAEVVIESAPLYGVDERQILSTFTAPGTFVFATDTLRHRFSGLDAMLRWHRFWPALRLPQDQLEQPLLTDEHGIGWSLDLTLEVAAEIHHVGALSGAGSAGGGMSSGLPGSEGLGRATDGQTGVGRYSLDTLLSTVRGIARQGRGGMAFDPWNVGSAYANSTRLRRF